MADPQCEPEQDLPAVLGDRTVTESTLPGALNPHLNVETPSNTWEDDSYIAMKQHFLMTGKGRRPHLPTLPLTNQILLQLNSLRVEGQATWDTVLSWFVKLFPHQTATASQLQHKIQSTCESMKSLSGQELYRFMNSKIDFNSVPPVLANLGLNRPVLLGNPSDFFVPVDFSPTLSILVALENVRSKECLPASFVAKWMLRLTPPCVKTTPSQVKHKLSMTMTKVKTLKQKKKFEELTSFLEHPVFDTSQAEKGSKQDKVPDHERGIKKMMENELSKLKATVSKMDKTIEDLELRVSILKEERESLQNENEKLRNETKRFQSKAQLLKHVTKENSQLKESLRKLRQTTAYRNNTQLRKDLSAAKETISQNDVKIKAVERHNESLTTIIDTLKTQVKSEQTKKSNVKKNLEAERCKSGSLLYSLHAINDEASEVKLKDNRCNKFTNSVRKTYMALQGEANVAATNCSKVVLIVANSLFGLDITMKDLPCTSSALTMMCEGNHIAKHQVIDEIKKTDHYTYASDGTSREKAHYMERHIVLSNGRAISMGFTKIASDDAKSLLDQTITIFEDFTEVYGIEMSPDEREHLMKEVIRKMKSLMSDRAANMKLFNRILAEWKSQFVEEDPSIHFLYCNAHFLLGLSAATEAAVCIQENLIKEDMGQSLGRDKEGAKFSRFAGSKESSACRVIRTASDVLGPRGDERSGCREEWLVYCASKNIKSTFSSYRSNRFNNLFENAQATLQHRHHILDFLTHKASASNLKLHSIIADLKDPHVMSIVSAIAFFHLSITGPYWKLMNSTLPYGSFPKYVRLLEDAMRKYSTGSIPVAEAQSVFSDFEVQDSNTKSFLDSEESLPEVVESTFVCISQKCFDVLNRQLVDFLDGGVFGGDIDADVQRVLDTCPLTNLIGEKLFGDLDYDLHKRKRASLHLRSTLSMWKKNATANWLDKQGEKKQNDLMDAAMKNSDYLKQKSKEAEKRVREKILEKMKENERTKKEKEMKGNQKKAEVLDAIIAQGGVCKTRQDVDSLYRQGNAGALKIQILYRKLFLGEKNLRVTGRVKTLYESLVTSVSTDNEMQPTKRQRVADGESSSSDIENEGSSGDESS